jgi:putative membrane protein
MNVVVSHWSANLVVLAIYLVAAVAYLIGVSGAATSGRRQGQSRPAVSIGRAVAFQAGLLLAMLAVVSPLRYWSYHFIWVRNVQDVVLAIAAPVLIVLGAPWRPLARGLGLGGVLNWLRPAGTGSPDDADRGSRQRWQVVPIVSTVAFSALWWAWHLPVLFDAPLSNSLLYAVEVASYLGLGIAFWVAVAGARPLQSREAPLHRVALLVAAAASGTILGLIRVYSPGLAYPAYLGAGHHVLSVVADQQVGGAVLWVIPLVPFSILAVALCIRWLSEEESAATEAGLDRLLKPRKSAWASRPGLR